MNASQKVIKYLAICFAIGLAVSIICAIVFGIYTLCNSFGLINNSSDSQVEIYDEYKTIYENKENYDNISNIEIELSYSSLEIKLGDSFKIQTNNDKILIEESKNTITLKDDFKYSLVNPVFEELKLIIYVPEDMPEFTNAEIITGAGVVSIDKISTRNLKFEVGAGKTIVNELDVKDKAIINTGAGTVEINKGQINNLRLDMGVGKVKLNSIFDGKTKIEAGIGKLDINLLDGVENYNFDVTKGVGSINIKGIEIKEGKNYFNGAEKSIQIEGGVGAIDIK